MAESPARPSMALRMSASSTGCEVVLPRLRQLASVVLLLKPGEQVLGSGGRGDVDMLSPAVNSLDRGRCPADKVGHQRVSERDPRVRQRSRDTGALKQSVEGEPSSARNDSARRNRWGQALQASLRAKPAMYCAPTTMTLRPPAGPSPRLSTGSSDQEVRFSALVRPVSSDLGDLCRSAPGPRYHRAVEAGLVLLVDVRVLALRVEDQLPDRLPVAAAWAAIAVTRVLIVFDLPVRVMPKTAVFRATKSSM